MFAQYHILTAKCLKERALVVQDRRDVSVHDFQNQLQIRPTVGLFSFDGLPNRVDCAED
jgi:hypothetical protein